MKRHAGPAALLLAVFLVVLPASGRSQAVYDTWNPDNLVLPAGPEGELPAVAAQIHIPRGDRFAGERQYSKARKEYRAAAELTRGEGGFPVIALRRIALAYYYEGLNQHAMAAFDALAGEAATVGDVGTQAWAMADAIWVLWKHCMHRTCSGGRMAISQRQDRIRRLLKSGYLADEDLVRIADRSGISPVGEVLAIGAPSGESTR